MFLSILGKKRALIAFPYSIGPKGRIKRPAGTRSQLQNGAVQRGIGAQPQQAKKTSGLTAGCPFFASVLTLALLAAFVPNSAQKWLYREKYYTESAEGRQMAQGVRL